MKIFDLTIEKMDDLENKYNNKMNELDKLLLTSEKDMWIKELNEFKYEYNKMKWLI
jgi:hypothetical protein